MYVRTYVCKYVLIYVRMMYIDDYMCRYLCMCKLVKCVCVLCVCMFVCVHVCHLCICVRMYMCVCMCACVHVTNRHLCILQANHLVGIKGKFLKLRFHSVEDLMKAKREIIPVVRRNRERDKAKSAYDPSLFQV